MGLLRAIARRAMNVAFERMLPLDELVQSSWRRAKRPEARVELMPNEDSPGPKTSQPELPWKKYELNDVPDLQTEQLLLQERVKKKEVEIAKESMAREANEALREVGYSSRLLIQATMPHSDPGPEVYFFERTNGDVTVKIMADPHCGLPFGTYPRLLLVWVTTEATRTKSYELVLGNSLSEFMTKLDLNYVGGGPRGSMPRIRQHMQRLFTSTVSATYERDGQWRDVRMAPVEQSHIFWDPKSPTQATLWQSTIVLNRTFYEEIVRRPVPVDMSALRALAKTRSPLAIDIYQWLTFRVSYLREDVTIPWEALRLQFGCAQKSDEYPTRAFKQQFVRRLRQVLLVYPDARAAVTDAGLLLKPSKTHVPLLNPPKNI